MIADQPLSRMTLADRLFQQLRQQILSGRLEAGETLPSEQDIGEAFGVGRTTVREALYGLVSSGLVERRGRALVVRSPDAIDEISLDFAAYSSISAVEQVYDVRKLLELRIVELAARNRSAEDLRQIEIYLERLHTDDPEAYHAADPEFHIAVSQASGNDVLHQLYVSSRQVFFKLPAYWRVFGKKRQSQVPRIGTGYAGHRALYEAIEAGDAARAQELTEQLLERVKLGLRDAISSRSADTGSGVGATTTNETEATEEARPADA